MVSLLAADLPRTDARPKRLQRVLLISTYELGHQPFGLAEPIAWLRRAGHDVRALDLAVERLDEQAVRDADLVAVYLPMHTATCLAARLILRVRQTNPTREAAGGPAPPGSIGSTPASRRSTSSDVTFTGFGGDPIKAWLLQPIAHDGSLPCVVEYLGYGRGRGHPLEWLLWASLGYAHLVVDARRQGGQWSAGETPDPAAGRGGSFHRDRDPRARPSASEMRQALKLVTGAAGSGGLTEPEPGEWQLVVHAPPPDQH